MPVAFDCLCGERWWSPPSIACARCGPNVAATPDPVVWSIGRVPGTGVSLSGQMRDRRRFEELVRSGFTLFVDVAGAAPYVWRPGKETIRRSRVRYVLVEHVEDTNVDLPDFAFDTVADALRAPRKGPALVFCAAGLKRSPHLFYGVLRASGRSRESAWDAILAARPFVDPWEPYLTAAERWVARRATAP